jgi:predicted regulator of Ras-like GTPase activity (Roadblock/LC7/MglB family)
MDRAARVSPERWRAILDEVTTIAGVRGAVVASADDGLVVYEAAMDGMATSELAALAGAVARRAEEVATALGDGAVRLCTLSAAHGTLVAVQGQGGLWLVAVADPDAELGRLRLLLGDIAPELA